MTTDTGKLAIDVPRDLQASFDPQLITKYQRRFTGFDEKIVSMYARGMGTREITGHLHDLYGIDVSPDLVSTVTDAVLGLWLEQSEGAKFWLRVMNELRNRGVEDILLAVVDGLNTWRHRSSPGTKPMTSAAGSRLSPASVRSLRL